MSIFGMLEKGDHVSVNGSKYPDTLVVMEKTPTHLLAYPNGGGFRKRIPIEDVERCLRKVEESEMLPVWVKARFHLEEGPSLDGYHTGERWNGWACPEFPLESAKRAMRVMEKFYGCENARYDEAGDKFVLTTPDMGGESDEYEGHDIVVDGEEVHVYPVGTAFWTWMLCEEEVAKSEG